MLNQPFYHHHAQPQTHLDNLSCPHRFFNCKDGSILNQDEIQIFWNQFEKAKISFDINNLAHFKLLNDLFQIFFNRTPVSKDQGWLKIGFQSTNPATDFRAGGIWALQNLYDFIRKHKAIAIAACEDKQTFFMACISIGITSFLKKMFHLTDCQREQMANRVGLKNYLCFATNNRSAFEQLHHVLLLKTIKQWTEDRTLNPSLTIMDFGQSKRRCQQWFTQSISVRPLNLGEIFKQIK